MLDVFEIVVQLVNGLTELSHLTIEPLFPVKVNKPLVEPEQMVVPPDNEPATVVVFTVTVVVLELTAAQLPL